MKKYGEMRRKERELNEGDMVYLKIEPYSTLLLACTGA
jgi:hypothetical protein